VETAIHASFYRVSAEYFKSQADYVHYYKSALLFLACVNVDEMSVGERVERAYDLAMAALLGDNIYNFGELVRKPWRWIKTTHVFFFLFFFFGCVVNASCVGLFDKY
jgi:26S proteasome regulatory subunit N9